MSFGLRIWGDDGRLQMDENSFTVRVIYSAVVGGDTTVTLPGVTAATHSAVIVPIGAYPQDPNAQNAYACQFIPIVQTGSVRVYRNNPSLPSSAPGLAAQRLIVMKFK